LQPLRLQFGPFRRRNYRLATTSSLCSKGVFYALSTLCVYQRLCLAVARNS
jgi:hypothetical protein